MLFIERCGQADIPDEERKRSFSIMICRNARQFYFYVLFKDNLDLSTLASRVKERFQTPERTRHSCANGIP